MGLFSAESKLDTIVARELRERVRSRWFAVATLVGPVFIAFLAYLPSLLQSREQSREVTRVRIIDATRDSVGALVASILEGGIAGGRNQAEWLPVTDSVMREGALRLATRDVARGRLAGYLQIDPDAASGARVRYAGRNTTALFAMAQIEATVTRAVLQRRLEANGLDPLDSESLARLRVPVTTERLTERGRGSSGKVGIVFALGVAFTLYLTIFMHGSNVMRGVLEEKQSRVAEVVLSSVPSTTLLFGKVLGIGAVGFLQLGLWTLAGTALMAMRAPLLALVGIPASPFALPELSGELFVVLIFSFLLGFLFYAALFAAVGAMVANEQDAQQAQLPVVLMLALSMASIQGIVTEPEGPMARLLTLVPFSAPLVLPLRLSLVPVPRLELIGAIVLLTASAFLATLGASRIYRTGALMYGKRATLREAWTWMRRR